MLTTGNFLKRETRNFSQCYLMLDCAKDEPIFYSKAKKLCEKIIKKIEKRHKQIRLTDLQMVLFEQNVRAFREMIVRIIDKNNTAQKDCTYNERRCGHKVDFVQGDWG